jgi:hypothetical protein
VKQVEVFEDLAGHCGVFDGRDQAHGCATARAAQRIHLEKALEKLGPREPARTPARAPGRWDCRCFPP